MEILTEIPIEIFSELTSFATSYYVKGGDPRFFMIALEPLKALKEFGTNESNREDALFWFRNSSYSLLEFFNSMKFPRKNTTVLIGNDKVNLNTKQYLGYKILFPPRVSENVVMNWVQRDGYKLIENSKGRKLMKKFHNDVFKWFTKLKLPSDIIDNHKAFVLENNASRPDSDSSKIDEMIKSLGSIEGQITPPTSVNNLPNTKDVSAAKALFDKGEHFESKQKYEEAYLSYSQALDLNPNDVNLWCAKGNILETISKNIEALDCYKKGLKLFPHDETLLSRTGFTLETLNRHEEALKYYQKMLVINPNDGNTWNNKGVAFGTLRRYEEALECYDEAIRLNSTDFEAWFNRGTILEIKKNYHAALESFIKVTELDSSDSEAREKVESLSKKVR